MMNKDFRKNFHENIAWKANITVCGTDEVGRGCIAGPLVTAAVILPINMAPSFLKDSKSLTEKELLQAYRWITKYCSFSIGIASNYEIDKYNIWQSTLIAMKRAVVNLLTIRKERPHAILVDAMPLRLDNTGYEQIPVHSFSKGESLSSSIAAASIIAKVTRDRIMGKLEALFPGYQLRNHKGYGTKIHKNALDKQKHSIMHRVSFLNKTFDKGENEQKQQQSLF